MKNDIYKIVSEAFAGKVDKGGAPYVDHLFRVAGDFESSSAAYRIALLHDILEDCPEWTEKRLRGAFNARICDAVVALTKVPGEAYQEYLLRVAANPDARAVKIADLEDNMNVARIKAPLTDYDLKRLKKYHDAYLYLSSFNPADLDGV